MVTHPMSMSHSLSSYDWWPKKFSEEERSSYSSSFSSTSIVDICDIKYNKGVTARNI